MGVFAEYLTWEIHFATFASSLRISTRKSGCSCLSVRLNFSTHSKCHILMQLADYPRCRAHLAAKVEAATRALKEFERRHAS